MKILKTVLILFAFITILSSCKKDDETPVIPIVNDTYWKSASANGSITALGQSMPFEYNEAQLKDKGYDWWFWLNANGKCYMDKVKPTEKSTIVGTWVQNSDKIALTITNATLQLPIKSTVATVADNLMAIPFANTYPIGLSLATISGTLICTQQ